MGFWSKAAKVGGAAAAVAGQPEIAIPLEAIGNAATVAEAPGMLRKVVRGAKKIKNSKLTRFGVETAAGMALMNGVDRLLGGDGGDGDVDTAGAVDNDGAPPSSLNIEQLPSGHVRVSFDQHDPIARHLDPLLAAFGSGFASDGRKTYTLGAREYQRLVQEHGLEG